MKDKLEFLIKKVLGDDAEFSLHENQAENGYLVFDINVSDESKPHLIGKGGRSIRSITNLLNIEARKNELKVVLKIQD